ncbi:sulfatase family protein [Lacunimicrobium album]
MTLRFVASLIAICIGIFLDTTSADAQAPPNIVLILSDDQAWTDYGFMKHPQIKTPHLDKLASQSLVYTRGYVPNSLCRPSLATIITGQYAHQHGIVGNDPPLPDDVKDMPLKRAKLHDSYFKARETYISKIDQQETIPDYLAKLGYLSFQSGKWWEGHYSRGGFTHGMTHGDLLLGARHGDEGLAIGRKGMKPVFEFIETAKEDQKPFFLWYAPMMPHSPHKPPERLLTKYAKITPHVEIAKYWAMCEWFDETIGELMSELERQKLSENTIVLYVADNGWINEADRDAYAPRSKRSQYDGGLRTPIMVSWPGKITPTVDNDHLASSIDLLPTILHATGITPPADLPGINLLDTEAVASRNAIYGEILEHDIVDMNNPAASLRFRWIIDGDWKLIVPVKSREPKAQIELFNIQSDPTELKNLAAQNSQRVQQLQQKLDAWWNPAVN